MAVKFPDPNIDPVYVNPATNEVYNWNPETLGWRRALSNIDEEEFVKKAGDTMTGPFVQSPGTDTTPGAVGNLTTNTPRDTSLEFRYQGQDEKVRCVTLPLTCCQTVEQRTHIQIQGGGSGFANVDDVLVISADAIVDPGAPSIDVSQWQRETGPGTFVFEDIANETSNTYTVTSSDLSLRVRVRQTFLQGDECETIVPSNVIAISTGAPPPSQYLGISFGSSTLEVEMDLDAPAKVYRFDSGNWTLEDTLLGGAGVQFSTTEAGFIAIDSSNMTALRFSHSGVAVKNQDIALSIDEDSYLGSIRDASYMFYKHINFNQDLAWWNTTNVTSMRSMFQSCFEFNQNIGTWITTNVENMSFMFQSCQNFNQPLADWSTANVTDMRSMFSGCEVFNKDISRWDTTKVVAMSSMFFEAKAFDQELDIWATDAATNMEGMFSKAEKFNSNISSWETGLVTNMDDMFSSATKFNQDLSVWCVPNILNKPDGFDTDSGFKGQDALQPIWGTCYPRIVSNPVIA